MNFVANLRRELLELALNYSNSHAQPHYLSYGEPPSVCFAPDATQSRHGNFFPASYKAIISNPAWRQRFAKVHTQGRHFMPPAEHGRWRELDACTSSDALLMNIFCH